MAGKGAKPGQVTAVVCAAFDAAVDEAVYALRGDIAHLPLGDDPRVVRATERDSGL